MKSIFVLLIALTATVSAIAQKANEPKAKPNVVQVQYTCPMHPDVVSAKPGKCPKCNMDLSLSKKEQMKAEVTNNYSCPVHTEVVSDHAGICAKCQKELVVDRRGSKQVTATYTCSMHPDVTSNTPGKCPVCNMDLTTVKSKVKKA